MILVVGTPAWRSGPPPGPAGSACLIALAAAAHGGRVELVGRVGEDAVGDALLLALGRVGVGHAAVLRDPTRPTPLVEPAPAAADDDAEASPFADPEPSAGSIVLASASPRLDAADLDLAVKYLSPTGVMVVTDDVTDEVLAAAVAATAYAHLRLVVLLAPARLAGRALPAGLPEDATVLAAPDADDGAFEALVGAYAAALDDGADPAAAFAAAQGGTGWELAPAD